MVQGWASSMAASSAGGVDFWRPEDQAFGEAAGGDGGGLRFAFQLTADRGVPLEVGLTRGAAQGQRYKGSVGLLPDVHATRLS